MGLIGSLIIKGVETVAAKAIIEDISDAAQDVIKSSAEARISVNKSKKDKTEASSTPGYIKPALDAEDCLGRNAIEIARSLLGCGFEEIVLEPKKCLWRLSRSEYGNIRTISINANMEFTTKTEFPPTSYVLIQYAEFKSSVDISQFRDFVPITPGVIRRTAPTPPPKPKQVKMSVCPHCGAAIKDRTAVACAYCDCLFEET